MFGVVLVLSAIAAAAAVRRMIALSYPALDGPAAVAQLDAVFLEKAGRTSMHVLAGLILAIGIPMQMSARLRSWSRPLHRRLGRVLVVIGAVVGVSGFAMLANPVGGMLEVAAIVVFGSAFLFALTKAWVHARRRDIRRHREWMIRTVAIVLGVATTRPVMGVFFATMPLTALEPAQFFGVAFWIGFGATAMAGEWYVRATRRPVTTPVSAPASPSLHGH
jgi:uncharacterized membrane protein